MTATAILVKVTACALLEFVLGAAHSSDALVRQKLEQILRLNAVLCLRTVQC